MATTNKKQKETTRKDSAGSGGGTIKGTTVLSGAVVETIAGLAAAEVDGIHHLGRGTLGRTIARLVGNSDTVGVDVEVGTKETAIDLDLVVEYDYSIPEVAKQLRQAVAKQVKRMTGLEVVEININVANVHFAGTEEEARVA